MLLFRLLRHQRVSKYGSFAVVGEKEKRKERVSEIENKRERLRERENRKRLKERIEEKR